VNLKFDVSKDDCLKRVAGPNFRETCPGACGVRVARPHRYAQRPGRVDPPRGKKKE